MVLLGKMCGPRSIILFILPDFVVPSRYFCSLCVLVSQYPLFVFIIISNEKKPVNSNSEPALVMGCALVGEGKACTEGHWFNCLVAALKCCSCDHVKYLYVWLYPAT